jgi:hypothetical protein
MKELDRYKSEIERADRDEESSAFVRRHGNGDVVVQEVSAASGYQNVTAAIGLSCEDVARRPSFCGDNMSMPGLIVRFKGLAPGGKTGLL